MTRARWTTAFCAVLLACESSERRDDWPQWGRNPQHTGLAEVAAQPLDAVLAEIVSDPFVSAEKAESGDDLFVHYPVPLLEDDALYLGFKAGAYRACDPPGSGRPFPCGADAWGTQTWGVKKLQWRGGSLTEAWNVATDWKPVPNGAPLSGWEPVFHPVLTRAYLWVPAASGGVLRVAKDSGRVVARLEPFRTMTGVFVAGGLAADEVGNVYYNAVQLAADDPWGEDVLGAWLVRITLAGTATTVPFGTLVAGAPRAGDLCTAAFSTEPLPWPPGTAASPPRLPCGSQRPGINVIPAVSADGTIFTVSRAHRNGRYGYVVAVHADLSPRWAASLRGALNDGCDVLVPPSGGPGGCRLGAGRGVDPETNEPPAGRVRDESSSSPVVVPDGGVLYGAYTRYNGSRGHLFHFGPDGRPLATYDFGWDITPAVFPHGGSYSIVVKDNRYDAGSYCDDPAFCPAPPPRFAITQLDSHLRAEWSYLNTTDESCRRDAGGGLSCVPAPPGGFEWCVNQPAVDANGVVHANAEDGYVYAIDQGGELLQRAFLDQALGAAYTPLSIGRDGLVYAQNNGRLFVVGRSPRP